MCGIFGVLNFDSGGLLYSDAKLFMQGMIADSVRGMDGTGAFSVLDNGKVATVKYGGTPIELFATGQMENWIAESVQQNGLCFVGHNRYATSGKHTTENAHPFTHKHITLVHNGNFQNRGSVLGRYTDLQENDSESLCEALTLGSPLDILPKIAGALSIVFWDSNAKKLGFYRNKERPMVFASLKGRKKIIFGSEAGMIQWLCDRNGLEIKSITDTSVDKLYLISPNGKIKMHEITSKPVWGMDYSKSTPAVYGSGRFDWEEDNYNSWGAGKQSQISSYMPTRSGKSTTTVSYSPPPSPERPVIERLSNAQSPHLLAPAKKNGWEFPSTLLGYKVGDTISFGGVDRVRASEKQDQFKIIGNGLLVPEFEIWAYTKGDAYSRKCLQAAALDGKIRGFRTLTTSESTRPVYIAVVSDLEIKS